MHELLPFGEYVSPEQTQSAQNLFMGQFEAWELERILARLAVTSTAPGLTMARRRGQPRAEPVAVQGELSILMYSTDPAKSQFTVSLTYANGSNEGLQCTVRLH